MTNTKRVSIQEMFHQISPKILALAAEQFNKNHTITAKDGLEDSTNFTTEADVAVEQLILQEIHQRFPDDRIIAEESQSDIEDRDMGNVWIIDPICGTGNFAKRIKFFCSNIAYAEDGQLVASCVVDHALGSYLWSTGGGQIYRGDRLISTKKSTTGVRIEVDFPAAYKGPADLKKWHAAFLREFLLNTPYVPLSYATSLGFAYTALGDMDGYVVHPTYVWDVAAANFLLEQSGGVVSELDGSPWKLTSNNVLGARTPALYKELLSLLEKSRADIQSL